MVESSIAVDLALAELARVLALLSRRPPHRELLARHAGGVEAALDRFADGYERGAPDVAMRAHTAYVTALGLAKILSCVPAEDRGTAEHVTRFRRTATRLLDMLDRFVSVQDRALRASLLADDHGVATERVVARA